MAEFPALPLWTDAYIADTAHLTNEEHGVYLRLLMYAWRTAGCCLPDDDKRLALMVGVTLNKWAKLKPTIMAFFTLEDGVWRQKRLTRERKYVETNRAQKRDAGRKSAQRKSLKNSDPVTTAVGPPLPTGEVTDAQHPYPYPEEKEEPGGSSKKKGFRMSEDWNLPAAWASWAEDEGLPGTDVGREAERFRDHWLAKAGPDGLKADWFAAWRIWVRKAIEIRMARGCAGQQEPRLGETRIRPDGTVEEYVGGFDRWMPRE